MTKREAEMLAKNWRLGNRHRKKSLTKKYDLKTATSGNTGRVKMGIRIDIENNPKDYKAALDDDLLSRVLEKYLSRWLEGRGSNCRLQSHLFLGVV